jgi:hypothetical protein
VKHNYQTIDAAATALGVPEAGTVAIGEVIADVREGCWRWPSGPGCR